MDAVRSAPLAGLVVVDLTRVLAGPFATMLLADLGARVIKVEQPGSGDDARTFPPFVDGESAYFASVNRGKESIALDLKDENDRAILWRLLARADVLVENFRPGALERLGFGWSSLHARLPRLILASVSGFGQTGPLSQRPAYDVIVQAMSGMMSITGHPGQPPVRVGTSLGDLTAGLFAVIGILAALRARDRDGAGTWVDIGMLDGQLAILENAIVRYLATGQDPEPSGSRHPSITPFQAYACADAPIVIAAGNDTLFRRLVEAIGLPELSEDERFATNARRTERWQALQEILERRLATAPAEHWLGVLADAGVPAGPVHRVSAALAEPHVTARRMRVSTRLPSGTPIEVAGNPVKLWGFDDPPDRPAAPRLDGDRAAILAWLDRPEG
ncbi:MAG: CoA transferase [Sphingomonadaceae bacterium]|uniref:CaiB/BaiF CoA transferase family protein n=1 Tax=Thermaurantiacus sp. TaxID=2820283 RepID=UPI00298F16A9|nr:CoA transferase [Thermaurantiacus sp.]MCS6987781.1 CoA transferase [Sphingomonadaceae bacterium]MDW8414999.1 CoA transferase [Thermaurantiacus sp.]